MYHENNRMTKERSFRKARFPWALFIIFGLIIGLALIGTIIVMGRQNKEATSPKSGKNALLEQHVYSVGVEEIQPSTMIDYFKINGDVIASNLVNVFPDVQMGRLISYNVRIGEYVNRNQVIGYIDPSQPGVNYAPNPIRSPISGTIIALPLDAGTRVTASSLVAQVGNLNSLQIEGFVPERLIGKLILGTNVNIKIPAFPHLQTTGRVTEIAPAIDVNSRTVLVKVQMNDVPAEMKSGMFLQLYIEAQAFENVLVVPQKALINRGGKTYLFTVSSSEAEAKSRGININQTTTSTTEGREVQHSAPISGWATLLEVQTGFSIDGKVIITNGLYDGDKVITSGQNDLSNALPINIIDSASLD